MNFYNINNIEELTIERIQTIVNDFKTRLQPIFTTRGKYYNGTQKIKNKAYSDTSKPCTKAVVNYCKNIVENYNGYLTGKAISYVSDDDIEDIQQTLKYNDSKREDSLLLRNALIFGVGYEVVYMDEDKQIRFKGLDSCGCIPIFNTTLNEDLIAVLRFWPVDSLDKGKGYYFELYNDKQIITYKSDENFSAPQVIDIKEHYFKQVPIIVYKINDSYDNIFDCIVDLQDAYNELYSSEIDDFEAFVDAYLVLKGANLDIDNKDDAETLKNMRENRVMLLDNDGSAEYLTKQIDDTQIQNLLQNTNDMIHKISNSPDFNDEKFLAQSGIAMKYKLTAFENAASNIESYLKESLQRRIELISTILTLSYDDISVWRDIDIVFTRNLPENLTDIVTVISQLRGLVSDETLLSLLPFVSDPKAELEKQKADKPKVDYFPDEDDAE